MDEEEALAKMEEIALERQEDQKGIKALKFMKTAKERDQEEKLAEVGLVADQVKASKEGQVFVNNAAKFGNGQLKFAGKDEIDADKAVEILRSINKTKHKE